MTLPLAGAIVELFILLFSGVGGAAVVRLCTVGVGLLLVPENSSDIFSDYSTTPESLCKSLHQV